MSDHDIAWAAGLFEGEGCFTAPDAIPHRIIMTVTSTDRDVLERFQAILDCGAIHCRKMPADKPHWRQSWSWQATGTNAERAVARVLPYLGDRRTTRIREVLAARASYIAEATHERVCPICVTPFRPSFNGQSWRTTLCSTECKKARNRIKTRELNRRVAA